MNVELPDSLFAGRWEVFVDPASVDRDSLLLAPGAAVPLTRLEMMAYENIDSTQTLEKVYEPTGLLAGVARGNIQFGPSGQGGDGSSGPGRRRVDFDFAPDLSYDRVEALRFGGAVTASLPAGVNITGGVTYSTGPSGADRWGYAAAARARLLRQPSLHVSARYRHQTEAQYATNRYGSLVNSAYTVLGGADYFDYYRADGVSGGIELGTGPANLRFGLSLTSEEHRAVVPVDSADFVRIGSAAPRINPAAFEGTLRSVGATIRIGETGAAAGAVQAVSTSGATLQAEWSLPSSSLMFDFARYEAAIDFGLATFYRRRLLPNRLNLRLVAGTSSGTLPPQRRGVVDASMSVYRPFGVLHTREGIPLTGDRHVGFFWEHNFRTIPFELVGWDAAARNGYAVLLFGGHGRAWNDDEQRRVVQHAG